MNVDAQVPNVIRSKQVYCFQFAVCIIFYPNTNRTREVACFTIMGIFGTEDLTAIKSLLSRKDNVRCIGDIPRNKLPAASF